MRIISPDERTPPRRQTAAVGREAVPAGGLATCSRAVRASCLPALRPVCGVRRWKWVRSRRSYPPRWQSIHEAWPGSHQGTTHPLGRAVVERRKASRTLPFRGRRRTVKGAEVTALRLPAFHILSFVIARNEAIQRPRKVRLDCFAAARNDTGETGNAKRHGEANHPSPDFLLPLSRFTWLRSGGPHAKARAGTGELLLFTLPCRGRVAHRRCAGGVRRRRDFFARGPV
jgi:hypothetical protein